MHIPKEAISIVLRFNQEVFTIVRQNYLTNFPGYTAFPGGKIDEIDYQASCDEKLLFDLPPHHRNCLIREAKEELGIDILKLIQQSKIQVVEYIAKAISPEFNPYRFETFFYQIHFSDKPDLVIDNNEVMQSCWIKPQEVLNDYFNGKRLCVPPVRKILDELSTKSIFNKPITFENRFDFSKEVPHVESIYGIHQIMPLSDTLPPANRTNAFVIGDLLIDPSPKDEIELKKFLYVISNYRLKAIFLTHHHSDHYQNLQKIVNCLNLPVWLSEDTFKRIKAKNEKDFFKNIEISIIKDKDVVTKWLDKDVIVMSIPGHDEGHLGLYPITKEWFLAGDLFQGIGTVVISPDEGDMQKYFSTLEKVINLSPACVIPSHGIPLGGTTILEKTLKHRKMREKQVLDFAKQDKSIDEMLALIYPDLSARLLKLAKLNIESHLIKLKKENLL